MFKSITVGKKKPKKGTNGLNTSNMSKTLPSGSSRHAEDEFQEKLRKESAKRYTKEDLLAPTAQLRELSNGNVGERTLLMIKKLKLCCVVFEFSEPEEVQLTSDEVAKENKRKHLLDLIEYVTNAHGWFCEEIVPVVLESVSCNLFRCLPPSPYEDWDPEEDEPALDPQWHHLQFVYEFLLRFLVSSQAEVKILRKYIRKNNKQFLINIIHLFKSEDPREREYLKTILHRIYGKFMAFRSFIRKRVNFVFYSIIFSETKHNGISELLEIQGSIINGFALPLKAEHVRFLKKVLIPLHKVPSFSQFSQQLAYCVTQFIDKDPSLGSTVIEGLLNFWPKQSASKEQLFLNELEEVLETSTGPEVTKMLSPLFAQVARCVESPHFQVSERALFLWNNDAIASFTNEHREQVLPIIYPSLNTTTQSHWNSTVHSLAFNIVRMFMEMDIALWEKMGKEFQEKSKEKEEKVLAKKSNWDKLRQLAKAQRGKMEARSRGKKQYREEAKIK